MSLSPVSRTSLIDEVFDQLVGGILSGDLVAGEALPSERRLAEVLGVSRPAVREALQRLQQSGLVSVRQGGATTVRDFRRHAGLDLLPHLLAGTGGVQVDVIRSVTEVRSVVGPEVARLAAERAGAEVADDLDHLVDELAAADGDVDRQRIALAFWERIVDAADSIALRLLFNALRDAYEPALGALAAVLHDEVAATGRYRRLADQIRARDGRGAQRAADRLLTAGTKALLAALDQLEEES